MVRRAFGLTVISVLALAGLGGCGGESEDPPIASNAANVLSDAWHSSGPAVVLGGQTPNVNGILGAVQGRANVVVANPQNRRDVWVGSGTGGVWRGDLSGLVEVGPNNPKWEPIADDAPSLAVGAIALDESTCNATRCNTVWVGTGENSIRRDTQYGRGILKLTWNASVGKYDWVQLGESRFQRGSLTKIVLDPTTPDGPTKRLYVALSSGVTSSATHATLKTTPPEAYGIWRSDDAGQNWVNVLSLGKEATDLEIDPYDPQILYAAFRNGGIRRRSPNGTWTALGGGNSGLPKKALDDAEWPELAVHRPSASPAVVYVALTPPCPHSHADDGSCNAVLYRSSDGGNQWTGPSAEANALPSYTHALKIHPTDPNKVWFGGTSLNYSSNGGASWEPVYLVSNGLHPDAHDIHVWQGDCSFTGCPSPSGVCAYTVTDGGFAAGNGNGCWNTGLQTGLQVMQFQSVSKGKRLLGGTQDNGVVGRSTGVIWSTLQGGDAASTVIEPIPPFPIPPWEIGDIVHSVERRYVDTPRRCMDGGSDKAWWVQRCALQTYNVIQGGINKTDPVIFYPPMELATQPPGPWTENMVFFGTKHLYEGGGYQPQLTAGWRPLSFSANGIIPVANFADINVINGNVITAIANAPSNRERIYIGYYDGTVLTTVNATATNPTWTRIDQSGSPLPDRIVTSIAVHPEDELRVYVALSGFSLHSVYVTANGGGSWQAFDASADANNEFATRPVNALFVMPGPPGSPHQMFAGTDEGAYSRATAELDGALWTKSVSMPNVAVYDFAADPDNPTGAIFAATHGRGVWRLSDGFASLNAGKAGESMGAHGSGFEAYEICEITLLAGGQICATSTQDADGADLSTDRWGYLIATKPRTYEGRPMAWACYDGRCAGGALYSDCRVDQVRLTCGSRTAEWAAADSEAGEIGDPGSGHLAFRPAFSGGATTGSFTLLPTLQHASGWDEVLCAVSSNFSSSDSVSVVLQRTASLVNSDPACTRAGVTASVIGSEQAGPGEDSWPQPLRLVLSTTGRTAFQLVPAVTGSIHAAFGLESVGVPHRVPVAPRLALAGVARGGSISVAEQTSIGQCRLTVPTSFGESAAAVRERVRAAFSSPIAPTPWCLEGQNPRDAILGPDGAITFAAAEALVIENTDPGLSYTLTGGS